MKNVHEVFSTKSMPVSLEIFPPKGELVPESARKMLEGITGPRPDFISVTCSAGGSGNSQNTSIIASMIQEEFAIPSIAHMTCVGATDETVQLAIDDLKDKGIKTVLALRGDLPADYVPTKFQYAKDLAPVLVDAGFCVGAAAYPEGHIACERMADNLDHLKQKQDAGASFFVTQLAFDNDIICRFNEQAKAAGVTAPITIGIMPFLSKDQISRMVFLCGASLPAAIIKLLAKYEHDAVALRQAGIEYATQQLIGLAERGVDGLHVYCMNHADIAQATLDALREAGFCTE